MVSPHSVGAPVGAPVGTTGLVVGLVVGLAVGSTDGLAVGEAVLGLAVGICACATTQPVGTWSACAYRHGRRANGKLRRTSVGAALGNAVGICVGAALGNAVLGSTKQNKPLLIIKKNFKGK